MNKDEIISEIRRTALENDGVALGSRKFHKVTGLKEYSWKGKYWRTWGEALKDAGLSGNEFGKSHDKDFLVDCLAKLAKRISRFPAAVDLQFARGADDTFPSEKSFRKLGSQAEKAELLRNYVSKHSEYNDIVDFLPKAKELIESIKPQPVGISKTKVGFVYLGMLKIDTKKRYKIGKTNLVERRNAELSLQLPEKLELIHYIRTDDMSGIEAYWHNRFENKNTNGEWFDLSSDEVRAFKLRKFM